MNRSTPNAQHSQHPQRPRYAPIATPFRALPAQLRANSLAAPQFLADALRAWQRIASGFHLFGNPTAKAGQPVILPTLPAQRRRAALTLLALASMLPLAACATNERETYLGARRTIISSAQGDASQRVSRLDQRATVARADDSQP